MSVAITMRSAAWRRNIFWTGGCAISPFSLSAMRYGFGLRQEAFVRALASPGYTCHLYEPPAARQVAVPHWEESQQVHVVEWISSLPRPLGILCASDLHAMPVLKACRELKIPVPEQIAVLGVDNDSVICGVTNPPLSSIDLDSRRIGYVAAALLGRKMSDRRLRFKPMYLPPSRVVTRQSTDMLAVNNEDVAEAIRIIREGAERNSGFPGGRPSRRVAPGVGAAVSAVAGPVPQSGDPPRADRGRQDAPRTERTFDRSRRATMRNRLVQVFRPGLSPRNGGHAPRFPQIAAGAPEIGRGIAIMNGSLSGWQFCCDP